MRKKRFELWWKFKNDLGEWSSWFKMKSDTMDIIAADELRVIRLKKRWLK